MNKPKANSCFKGNEKELLPTMYTCEDCIHCSFGNCRNEKSKYFAEEIKEYFAEQCDYFNDCWGDEDEED